MTDDTLRSQEQAFVGRFLPPGAHDAHSLLYGLGAARAPDFVPSRHAVDQCLDAYEQLVRLAEHDQPLNLILSLTMEASELVIAYLTRWHDSGGALPKRDTLVRRIRNHEPALQQFVTAHSGQGHDALKRLLEIRELLSPQLPQFWVAPSVARGRRQRGLSGRR